jgi:hypothetical protein
MMCESMMKVKEPGISSETYLAHFAEPMASLQNDKVVNVRMQLAETLA